MQNKQLHFLILILLLTACTWLVPQNGASPSVTQDSEICPTPPNPLLETPSPTNTLNAVDQPILISSNPPGVLATPGADSPAAGICAEPEEEIVVITFNIDVPDPRCAIVRPDQKLKVINHRFETVEATLGFFRVILPPGTEFLFDMPFGEYLEPGVHFVGCCGGELWLKDK